MAYGYEIKSGQLVATYFFDMTKLIAAHFELVSGLYRQTSLESYIVDIDGNFIIFG